LHCDPIMSRALRLGLLLVRAVGTVGIGCGDSASSAPPSTPDAAVDASVDAATDAPSTPDAPAPPAQAHAKAGAHRVTVSWDAVAGASSYTVYWSKTPGVTKATGTKIAGLAASPLQHEALLAGTYSYVVTATGVGGESAASTEASATVNLLAFASSVTGDGKLSGWPQAGGKSGVAAADAVCQTLATKAKLVGVYRAWMSDVSDDAYCRIQLLPGKRTAKCGQALLPVAAGPWVRMDGSAWAGTIDKITIGSGDQDVRASLRFDETGAVVETTRELATGTTNLGQVDTITCNSWTSSANADHLSHGSVVGVGNAWTLSGGTSCDQNFRALCMEMGPGPATLPSTPPTPGAKKAFLSSVTGNGLLASWADAGGKVGVAAGDAVCQARAAGAGLANASRFKAWLGLGPQGVKPVARLTSNGPWVRVDDVVVARDKAELGSDVVQTALNLDEHGKRVFADFPLGTWTGDGVAAPTCVDWTSAAPANTGVAGYPLDGSLWTNWGVVSCSSTFHLYCFED
jgi:hypothetical protein